jgi:hypothetical protein
MWPANRASKWLSLSTFMATSYHAEVGDRQFDAAVSEPMTTA